MNFARCVGHLCALFLLFLLVGCSPEPEASVVAMAVGPTATISAAFGRSTPVVTAPGSAPESSPTAEIPAETAPGPFTVQVDVERDVHPISPLIYGLSGGEGSLLEEIRPTLMSWGGNPSTRFNWRIGHAWNAARDWFYMNGNYGITSGSASDSFISGAGELGAEVRLALPTLGWVAKNDDNGTCSFPDENGQCTDGKGASCDNPLVETDPERTSVRSTPDDIVAWIEDMQAKDLDVRFFAMDNEPELWGFTHYDVHPECTTYEEILDKYLTYATAVREVAPEAELTGPVTCCWWYYWNSAAGTVDELRHGNAAFLPWFLEEVRRHDEETGVRTLDVLDIHFYPEGLYNNEVDAATAAHRLRSTRSLWDPDYRSESWIEEPIYLIPRMKELIAEHYPDTKLGISEWNWGADDQLNGALAIADVLGIFGREDLYFAAYWRAPGLGMPGMYAFKMYTNYDGKGSRFGDRSVQAVSSDQESVASYAAVGSETGNLHLMLLNKQPTAAAEVEVDLTGFSPTRTAMRYQYDGTELEEIVSSPFTIAGGSFPMTLPPYSLTLLVIDPAETSQ